MLNQVVFALSLVGAASAGVHRLKLQKAPPVSPEHVASYGAVAQLGEKYGVPSPFTKLSRDREDDLYWTQVQQDPLKDGHTVPLSSKRPVSPQRTAPDARYQTLPTLNITPRSPLVTHLRACVLPKLELQSISDPRAFLSSR